MNTFEQQSTEPVRSKPADNAPSLELLAADFVGVLSLDVMRERVLRVMLLEALTRTECNFSRAAMLLGVKRQAVQQMVTRLELQQWVRELKARATQRFA